MARGNVLSRAIIAISANTAEFERGMTRVERRLKRVRRAVKRFARVASVAIVATTATMVTAGLRQADSLAKVADKLGLATEALAGLRFAAAQFAGVSNRTLDTALQRMTRRIAEAARGTGEAQGAIKQLGLDARELVRLSPDQSFARIADSMQRIDNQAERVRLSFKLFDSEGAALVNVLGEGSQGIAEMRAEAERLGLALSREAAAKAEQATDALGRLKAAASGMSRVLAVEAAPGITRIADAMARSTARTTEAIREFSRFAKEVGARFAGSRGTGSPELDAVLRQLDELESRKTALQFIVSRDPSAQFALDELREIAAETAALTARQERLKAQAEETGGGGGSTFNRYTGTLRETTKALALFGEASKVLNETLEQNAIAASRAASIIREIETPIERFVRRTGEARDLVRRGLLSGEQFRTFRERLTEGVLEPLGEVRSKGERAFSGVQEAARQAARNMQTAFADFLFDPFESGLKGMLRGFVDTLRRMVAEAAAAQIFGGLFGSGGALPGIGKLLGFAQGGSFTVGGSGGTDSQVVAFRATPGERVEVSPKGRGGEITLVSNNDITINGTADGRTVATLRDTLERRDQHLKAEIAELLRRGQLV